MVHYHTNKLLIFNFDFPIIVVVIFTNYVYIFNLMFLVMNNHFFIFFHKHRELG